MIINIINKMLSVLDSQLAQSNKNNILAQIQAKNSWQPFIKGTAISTQVLTEYDTFPYYKNWRGIPHSPYPHIIEREAGWRPVKYVKNDVNVACNYFGSNNCDCNVKSDLCFETACSTVIPCHSTSSRKVKVIPE